MLWNTLEVDFQHLGLEIANIQADDGSRVDVAVVSVSGPAEASGLFEPGDILVSVDGHECGTCSGARAGARAGAGGGARDGARRDDGSCDGRGEAEEAELGSRGTPSVERSAAAEPAATPGGGGGYLCVRR